MAGQLSLKFAGAALLFAVTAGISSPAMAGFQWVAPSDASSAPPMVSPQTRSTTPTFLQAPADQADAGGPEIISPVVISGGSNKPVEKPVVQSSFDEMPVAPASVAPEPMMPAPPLIEPVKTTVKTTTVRTLKVSDNSANDGKVVGFAKAVPLAVALRQILPSGYAFSIDQDVDMGTLVSFKGGRGWRETLRDALTPVGLTMHENGQMVEVGYAGHNVTPIPSSDVTPTITSQTTTTISSPPPITNTSMDMPVLPMSDNGVSPVSMPSAWTAERGDHLRKVLEGWAQRANVEFDWMSEYDYPLEASVAFQGTFENAVRSLLTGFEGAHPQPVAELHSNPTLGQMVLVVTTRGNTNSD